MKPIESFAAMRYLLQLSQPAEGWASRMMHFWDRVTAPLIEALRPGTILQIGSRDDQATSRLVAAAARIGAVIHLAMPTPRFAAGGGVVLHPARGLDIVPQLAVPDLLVIDDDPNWYNIHGLLTAMQRRAERDGKPFPVTLVTQTAWPYARRDSYDEPAAIPDVFRHDYERAGILPGQPRLAAQNGLFADRCNAVTEYETRSGVLTALEDFVSDHPGRFVITRLPLFQGLVLLHPPGSAAERALQPLLASLTLPRAAAGLVADLDAARVALEIEVMGLRAARQALRRPEIDPDAATLARALLRRLRRAIAARLRPPISRRPIER